MAKTYEVFFLNLSYELMGLCQVEKLPDFEKFFCHLHSRERSFIFASPNKKLTGENIFNLLLLEKNALSLRNIEENIAAC
jgi:hypothetical protein